MTQLLYSSGHCATRCNKKDPKMDFGNTTKIKSFIHGYLSLSLPERSHKYQNDSRKNTMSRILRIWSDRSPEATEGRHMTCTDKQSPRPLLHLPRRGWIPRALLPCLPLTFHKPERIVTRLPLQARMTTADGPARVHGKFRLCVLVTVNRC